MPHSHKGVPHFCTYNEHSRISLISSLSLLTQLKINGIRLRRQCFSLFLCSSIGKELVNFGCTQKDYGISIDICTVVEFHKLCRYLDTYQTIVLEQFEKEKGKKKTNLCVCVGGGSLQPAFKKKVFQPVWNGGGKNILKYIPSPIFPILWPMLSQILTQVGIISCFTLFPQG